MRATVGILLSILWMALPACSFKPESQSRSLSEAQAFPLKTEPVVTAEEGAASDSLPSQNPASLSSQPADLAATSAEPSTLSSPGAPAAAGMKISSDVNNQPSADKATSSQQAQPQSGKQLQTGSILVNQPVGKIWEQVSNALKDAGFEIMQQDRSLNAYFVADKKASGGKYAGDTPVLQVKLLPVGQTTVITIQEASGASASRDTLKRLYNSLP